MTVKTRIAPSPTGEFHVGGLRTLLYNWAFAKKNSGKFYIRVEDTDRTRFVEGSFDRTLSLIRDLGLDFEDEIRVQSEHLADYEKHALELIEKHVAYYCFCSTERLKELRESQQKEGKPAKYDRHCLSLSKNEIQKKIDAGEKNVIRLKVPQDQKISFTDEVYGEISIDSNELDDQILLKSDGFPTYHLAVVIDDHYMGITHVMRGNDWLSSTPKRILLYRAFDWEIPTYVHLPNLKELGSNKKLSKRFGPVEAAQFLDQGYLPDAFLNFLMLLGWSPQGKDLEDKEIFSLDEFAKDFSLKKIQKTDLVSFDREKLIWMNGIYIRNLTTNDLLEKIVVWAKKYKKTLSLTSVNVQYAKEVLEIVQDRVKFFDELESLTAYFFAEPATDVDLLRKFGKEKTKEILNEFFQKLNSYDENLWESEFLEKICKEVLLEKMYKPKEAYMTLRVAISGVVATPPIFETMRVLGKKRVLQRIDSARLSIG